MVKMVIPDTVTACLFDLDGVITNTARVHFAAWKEMFDKFLAAQTPQGGVNLRPFEHDDYTAYVDGRLRLDGVRTFLASRGITLANGSANDPPAANTVAGLGARKNDLVQVILGRDGVDVFPGSIRFLEAAQGAGLRRAIVSASKNCGPVLAAAGLSDFFEVQIDGIVAAERNLAGKPAPDMFLAAASALGVKPAECALFEDAVAGVQAGRAGAFGWVIGVDRVGQAEALKAGGADVVITDLAQLLKDK